MKKKLLSLLAGVSVCSFAAEMAPSFTIPRIETASTGYRLDGKLNDKVWGKAAEIPEFVSINSNGKPVISGNIKNKTSVKIFYDVDALYLGFTCYESDPGKMILGLPAGQTVDVPIGGNDDCLEIMLFHPGSNDTYYHLRVVPSGAKEDARNLYLKPGSFRRDSSWNGKWSVKTSREKNAWYAEIKIPFRMFAEASPGFLGRTPNAEDGLRLNFGRVSSTTAEATTWQAGVRGFHSKFMDCRFGGFPFKEITVETPDIQHLKNGANKYRFFLRNLSGRPANVKLNVTLREDETDPEKRRQQLLKRSYIRPFRVITLLSKEYAMKAGEKIPVEIDFQLSGGGEKILSFNVDWLRMKHNISRGFVIEEIYDIEKGISDNSNKFSTLKNILAEVVQYKIPIGADVAKKQSEAEQLLTSGTNDKLPAEQRSAHLRALEKKLEELDFLISTTLLPRLWNVKNGKKDLTFSVGTALAGEKVFRDLPFTGTFSDKVEIACAQNEYESAQFVLFYLTDKKSEIKVTCAGLKGENGGEIKADQLFFNPIGYVNVGDSGHHTHVGYWPDVLYKGNLVKPPVKGSLQPVMLTLKTDKNQLPGNYTGTVKFESGKEQYELTLNVKVYPFALPDKKSFGMNIWFHGTRVPTFYGDFSPERFEQIMEVMGRYHFATGIRGNVFGSKIRVRGDNKNYTFDFSGVEPYFASSFKHNANVLNLDYFEPGFFAKERRILIGKDGSLGIFKPEDPAAAADQLFIETVKFFKEKGYYKYAVIQVSDEPWSPEKQEYIRKKVTHLRTLVKDLPPVISAGAIRNRSNLNGYIDLWCPQYPQFNPADYKNMPKNEKLYFYQCLYKQDFPMFMIDRPGIEPRISAMIGWKYQAIGFLYWASEQWIGGSPKDPVNQPKMKNRWVHEEWGFPIRDCPGDACFIYPTKEGVVASLRAQYMRDGVEDYEYLAILKQYRDLALRMGKMNAPLRRKVEALLKVPDHIVKTANHWTKSEVELLKFRREVAETIVQLKKATGK